MIDINKLRRAIHGAVKTSERAAQVHGYLGHILADGTYGAIEVVSKPGFVNVMAGENLTPTIARNTGRGRVALRNGLPIIMERDAGHLVIIGEDHASGLLDEDPDTIGNPYGVTPHPLGTHNDITAGTPADNDGYFWDAATSRYVLGQPVINLPALIDAAPEQTVLEDTNAFPLTDTGVLKFSLWSTIKTTLTTLFGTLYAPIAKGVTNGDAHDHVGGDGAAIPNVGLTNSSVTVGSTSIALGATAATVAGLTLTAPTIVDFTAAQHDHADADDGGTIAYASLTGAPSIPTQYTDEMAQDAVGAMVTGNTETGIAVTYDDATATLNFDAQTAGDARYALTARGVTNGDAHDHLGGDGATIAYGSLSGTPSIPTQYTDEMARDALGTALVGGAGVTITADDGLDTITVASTITQYTDEQAQDAVGAMLVDSGTIDFTYTDATPALTAIVIDGSITYAKMQDVSATDKLLGRSTAGAGDVEEIALTAAGRALIDDADATAQRVTLGLVIGTNVQAQDAELAALAGLTSAADKLPYFSGSGTAALADLSAFGRTLIDDAAASNARTTLGLGSIATEPEASYLLLAGRAGSQVANGGTAANEDLTIRGTAHATKTTSYVLLQDTGGNVGIGTTAPGQLLSLNAALPVIEFKISDVAKAYIGVASGAGAINAGSATGDIVIRGNSQKLVWSGDSGVTAHMILDAAGNVGIGVAPAAPLNLKKQSGYWFFNAADNVGSTPVTIMTGTYLLNFRAVVYNQNDGAYGVTGFASLVASGAGLAIVAGAATWTLSISAGYVLSVARTAGSAHTAIVVVDGIYV